MDFSKLRESVNTQEVQTTIKEVEHLYVGINPYIAKHVLGSDIESKRVIIDNPLDIHDLRFKGPSIDRHINITEVKVLNEDQAKKNQNDGIGDNEIKDQENAFEKVAENADIAKEPLAVCSNNVDNQKIYDAIFYKDGKFRAFGGRTQPQEFFSGEAFYSSTARQMNEESFYGCSLENVKTSIEPVCQESIVMDMEFLDSEVIVRLADNEVIKANKIYFGKSVPELVELTKNKDIYAEEFLNNLDLLAGPEKLIIELEINVDKFERNKTYFIPFSQNQESGHFIGEFCENPRGVTGKFIFHLNNDDPSEQYLTAVIKKLKSTLRRIFELSESNFLGEYIYLDRSPAPVGGAKENSDEITYENNLCAMVSAYTMRGDSGEYFSHNQGLTSLNY
tara:strand:- start:83 stop:1258 length:1176 start_codon:yes stop_codon:yes gene_type:complete